MMDARVTPRASVVLPAYNSARYLRSAIESILGQTFTDFELIVVDDCSKDDTWAIVEEYAGRDPRVIALRNDKNLNLANALNRAIGVARGEYIVRMDHDDIAMPQRVERQVAFLDRNPNVGIVGSTMGIMDEQERALGLRRYNLTDEEVRRNIILYSPCCHPATAIRKDVLERVGNYRHEFNPAANYGFISALAPAQNSCTWKSRCCATVSSGAPR